ncbi:MAG TPA: hypothetical protein VKI17_06625 [Gemmataceae bacterium]|nr:hypothetical protein [Gemmataceae bacterium]
MPRGVRLSLSAARKMSIEMLTHARRVPSVPMARTFKIAAVAAARQARKPVPSWTTIFVRAYGLVCREFAELRRAFMPWPRPHLYEHPHSTCALVVERSWQDEPILLGSKIRAPEDMPLAAIQQRIRYYKDTPVWEIGDYRQVLRFGRLPWLLRRFAFWQTLYLSGYKRAKRFGTFMVSSYGSLGAEQIHPIAPFTTLLTFGPIALSGEVVVKIVYDQRVLDGYCVARCLQRLEEILNTVVAEECHALGRKVA